jgi:glycoprotein endo-alpha-1,2-mannosidase
MTATNIRRKLKTGASGIVLIFFFASMILFLRSPQASGSIQPSNIPTFAFYYPWYGTPSVSGYWYHWNDANHNPDNITNGRRDISATDYPLLDVYDSNNETVISQHIQWAKQAGIGCFIISWWGINDFTDNASKHIREICERDNFNFTFYYESTTSINQALGDLNYLLNTYGNSPSYYKIDGRPVIFVFQRARDSLERGRYPFFDNGWKDVVQDLKGNGENPYIIMDFGGYEYDVKSFVDYFEGFVDGIHVYNDIAIFDVSPSAVQYIYRSASDLAHSYNKIFVATIVPGFDNTVASNYNNSLVVDRQDGATYSLFWQIANASRPDGYAVTSFNEWHEGTEIEPSREYGNQYLNLTFEFVNQYSNIITISEFTSWKIIPLMVAAALTAVIIGRKARAIDKLRAL